MHQPTWEDNKRTLLSLWPRWKPTDAEAALINERWSKLHQDKLRTCIENNRLKRGRVPDLAAIHREYCTVTGHGSPGQHQVERTRRYIEDTQGPTDAELAQWDREADAIMATASPEEIDAVQERLGISPGSGRVLALMVEYCRQHPRRR